MKKLITANDIREAHARGEQAMSVVLRASIITPEAREVADLLGFTITECDESIPVTASVPASVPADKTESQRIRETIIAQLPEGQFTESLVAQLMEKVMKEKQSLEQGAMQPSFKSVTGKGGIKVIDGSSVKFGRFDGAEPHCVGLTDLVTGDDGSSMAGRFYAVGERILPVDPELRRNRHGAGRRAACSPRRPNHDRQSRRRDVYPERLQHRIWYDIQREIPVCRLAG
ncbi:ethanolamine utilization protein [Escherichia coli]|uniref:Ethanolamine utilization protein n=1 Tax=Escherichia coli TaxID=562 RepID=A0A2X1N9V8_ECOLX|nr:ethanolamine utilization protein [Escherichia coli]